LLDERISGVQLLGSDEKISWKQEDADLAIASIPAKVDSGAASAAVFKISLR